MTAHTHSHSHVAIDPGILSTQRGVRALKVSLAALGRTAIFQVIIVVISGSAALVADGQHSRVDGFTSLAVLLGALGVKLGFPAADPIVGLLITLAIFGIVLQASRDVFSRVMDAVDPDMIDEIEHVATGINGVKSVHDIRARWLGHEILVDLSIGVDREVSVAEGHHLATHVHHELMHHIPHLHKVAIHVDPDDRIGEARHLHSH